MVQVGSAADHLFETTVAVVVHRLPDLPEERLESGKVSAAQLSPGAVDLRPERAVLAVELRSLDPELVVRQDPIEIVIPRKIDHGFFDPVELPPQDDQGYPVCRPDIQIRLNRGDVARQPTEPLAQVGRCGGARTLPCNAGEAGLSRLATLRELRERPVEPTPWQSRPICEERNENPGQRACRDRRKHDAKPGRLAGILAVAGDVEENREERKMDGEPRCGFRHSYGRSADRMVDRMLGSSQVLSDLSNPHAHGTSPFQSRGASVVNSGWSQRTSTTRARGHLQIDFAAPGLQAGAGTTGQSRQRPTLVNRRSTPGTDGRPGWR